MLSWSLWNLYTTLDSKDREENIYKLAKLRERKTRDFNQVNCIKSEDLWVFVQDDELKKMWKKLNLRNC